MKIIIIIIMLLLAACASNAEVAPDAFAVDCASTVQVACGEVPESPGIVVTVVGSGVTMPRTQWDAYQTWVSAVVAQNVCAESGGNP